MKKRLLTVAFALLTAATSFAYQAGDYAYNSTQRFKITGENIVQNGNFANGLNGWYGSDKETTPNVEIWDAGAGVGQGPNGSNAVVSLGASADAPLCNSWALSAGTYVVSFDFYSVTAGNTTNAAFFLTTGDSFTQGDGDTSVSASFTYPAEEWKSVVFFFTAEAGQNLVMNFVNFAADTKIANIEIHEASEVYDIRIAENRLAYAKELMENENFNVPEAAGERANLEGIVGAIEEMIAGGEMDDASYAEEMLNALEAEGIEPYLSVTSLNLKSLIPGLDIASLSTWGRGGNYSADYKLDLQGGNWGHIDSERDALRSAIQTGYANSAVYNAYHENLPAGKYFFTAEIRNANTGRTSWPTEPVYDLETICRMFIGADTIDVGPIAGETYQRFSLVAEVGEDGAVRAGVSWPGTSSGGAFMIRNTEFRAFDLDALTKAEHVAAFKNYMTQWNAATNNRTALINLMGNPNYPWGQPVAKEAYDKWNAFYTAQEAKGWSTADGADAGIASTEDFLDWALYQGVEEYDTDEEGNPVRKEYQVVRGFQNAANELKTLNAPLTNLADAIVAAKNTRNNQAYLTGDRDAYKTAILAALAALNDIRSTTTDATYAADSTKAADAKVTLDAATEAFLASATVKPFVDIDFANAAVENTDYETHDEAYYIQGAAGRMYSNNYEVANDANIVFTQGYIEEYMDVLRIGNGSATVYIDEENQPNDSESLRVTFDIWFGSLSGRYTGIELQNAAGERVAGFYMNAYNWLLEYNDFNDAENTGLDILSKASSIGSSSASNAAIVADNNRSSFDLVVSYKDQTLQGTLVNAKNGTIEGNPVPFRSDITDHKIVKFVIKSNYNNKDRRCWFDNLKISKYTTSDVEEDITEDPWLDYTPDGIQSVTNAAAAPAGIYTINGVKVSKATKPGLYIINGKKYVVK